MQDAIPPWLQKPTYVEFASSISDLEVDSLDIWKFTKNEKYECLFCNKEFSSGEKLHNHKEKMHDIKITSAKYA